MAEIIKQPKEYKFRNVNGHAARVVTEDASICILEIECDGHEVPMMLQNKTEFIYRVLSSDGGYFILKEKFVRVEPGDTISIPAGEEFSFGGYLRMLLMHKAPFMPEEEVVQPRPPRLARPSYEANGQFATPQDSQQSSLNL